MKHVYPFLAAILFIACNQPAKNDLDKTVVETLPKTAPLSPLQTAVQAAIIDIETKDITSAGNTISTINIDGMEIIKSSTKDYYMYELESQETNFKNYMDYLAKHSQNKNLTNPLQREESQRKHNAVIAYLKSKIKTAPIKPEIYKVVYYLKADTKNARYDQLKTTYLDTAYKKIVSDYSFLK